MWNSMDKIYYGGDYNPDQYAVPVWHEDMGLLAQLHANVLTLPVFSWAKLQPSEDEYNFEWLDHLMDLAEANGFAINLATPTAAQPPWMVKAYPDILPVDITGRKRQYGGRTQFCPNSPSYRRFSRNIAQKMALRYQKRQSLILWHINNEYGTNCYCENCRQAFILWLKEKYTTLENLNEKWYTNFWGHTYYHWDEIQTVSHLTELLPGGLGNRDGTNFQGMAIDYRRFMTSSIIDCYQYEAQAIKAITPDIPITTNIWGIGPWLNLFEVGKVVDVVSWDSYPTNEEHYSVSSFKHDIIRSLKKDENFILMEQTPNQQNWQKYNALKRPGVMRLMSYQTLAHGADAIMFFQIRQSRGACEKYHAAMIPHVGHLETRSGRELIALGKELEQLSAEILGTKIKPQVALMMNWDNWWSVEYSSGPSVDLNYFEILQSYYKVLNGLNLSVAIIEPDEELSQYPLILAPLLNMVSSKQQQAIEAYVLEGGLFVSTYFSGVVDENDLVYLGGYPGALKNVMGVWVEEVDALPNDADNLAIPTSDAGFLNESYASRLICEVIHLKGARPLAHYGKDYYQGTPCVTENQFGKGKAIYLGTQLGPDFLEELIKGYIGDLVQEQIAIPTENLEIVVRECDDYKLHFVMNHGSTNQEVDLKGSYLELFSGLQQSNQITVAAKDLVILKETKETKETKELK